MNHITRRTRTFIGTMVLAALVSGIYAGLGSHTLHPFYALALLALAAATSRMKVRLPGIEGNMSVNLPFLLLAVVNLSAVEAILIASVSTVVQCWPQQSKKFRPEQLVFNVSMMAVAASLANLIWNAAWLNQTTWASLPLTLSATTTAFFLGQTVPVAAIIKLSENTSMSRAWRSIVQLSFPYYVLSAGIASMLSLVGHRFGWQAAILVFPVMCGIHHSYRLYFGRIAEALPTAALSRTATAGA